MVNHEENENHLNNHSSDTTLTDYLETLNLKDIINENSTSEFYNEDTGLTQSLVSEMENQGILTSHSSLSLTYDK